MLSKVRGLVFNFVQTKGCSGYLLRRAKTQTGNDFEKGAGRKLILRRILVLLRRGVVEEV